MVGYSGTSAARRSRLPPSPGAKVVERHITLDRNMEGPDHLASLSLGNSEACGGIRQVEKALPWTGPARHVSQGELLNRENLAKSVIAARDIAEGETLHRCVTRVASLGQAAVLQLSELIGGRRGGPSGAALFESDLKDKDSADRSYRFP